MIHTKEKGVSPLVAVVLLIAISVILAAVIAEFTLNLQDILGEPVQAGVTVEQNFNETEDAYEVSIIWSSEGTISELYVTADGVESTTANSIGESIDVDNVEEGTTIRIIGVTDSGREGIIQTHTV